MEQKALSLYIKTADSCQLDCRHCYTRGSLAPKIYFNAFKTATFLKELAQRWSSIDIVSLSYHGGEPLLAPTKDMMAFYRMTKDMFPVVDYRIQSNLVLNLTDERMEFLKTVCKDKMGTSWDYDIRFENEAQEKLWESNVEKLVDENFDLTMICSVTKKTVEEMEPYQIIEYAIEKGFKYILFERITPTGNAITNTEIVPDNKELDEWFLRMYEQSVKYRLYNDIHNLFISELVDSYLDKSPAGCRNRMCEQSVITINADGSIGGCPNTAPEERYWHIDRGFKGMLYAPERLRAIACEINRNPICYECPVYDVCRGDCHQLVWQDDICPAPKSLMMKLKEEDHELLKKFAL